MGLAPGDTKVAGAPRVGYHPAFAGLATVAALLQPRLRLGASGRPGQDRKGVDWVGQAVLCWGQLYQ